MANPPRNPNEPLLSGKVMRKAFLWYGMLGALFSFAAFMFCQVMNGWHPGIEMFGVGNDLDPIYVRATTMALAAIVFTQIGEVWNCRTETASVFSVGLFSNKQINKGILFEIALIIFITLFPPFQSVFHTSPLVLNDFVFLVLLPPVILLLEEARKAIVRNEEPHRSQRRRHQAGTGKEVKMKVIVVGMGRMGTSLAHKLDRQGYEVCAIDQDPERLKALGPTFGGQTVAGVGFDREVLAAAGIDRASAVIACTASDETNIVVARISRQTYRVPRVIARLYEIGNAETYRRLGIQSISTTDWGVRRVCELLTFNELDDVTGIGSGDVRLVRADVPPMLEGSPIRELTAIGEISIVAVSHDNETFVPTQGTVLDHGDIIYAAVQATSASKFRAMLGMTD